MTDCLALWPSKPCGAFGKCVNGTCICENGWTQSLEYNYFVENEYALKFGLCNYNESIIQGLLIFYLVLSMMSLVGIIVVSITFNKLSLRVKLTIGSRSLEPVYILYRLVGDDALFGRDITLSVLYSIAWTVGLATCSFEFAKYISYLNDSYTASSDLRWISKYFSNWPTFIANATCGIGVQFFWISALVDDNQGKALILHRIFYLSIILNLLYFFLQIHLMGLIAGDMRAVIESKWNEISDSQQQARLRMKKRYNRLNITRKTFRVLLILVLILMGVFPLIWNWWLANSIYLGFLYLAGWNGATLFMLYVRTTHLMRKRRDSSSSNNSDRKGSVVVSGQKPLELKDSNARTDMSEYI